MAKLIKTNGAVKDISPKNGEYFELEELQDYVKGYIEIINLHNGQILVVNEEGKCNGFYINTIATHAAHLAQAISYDDYIVGDVILCNQWEVR